MEAIKHKNLMVPRVLNTVKCVVEGICLGKGHYTYHFLCSFFPQASAADHCQRHGTELDGSVV